jgi:hypothetical protein
MLKEAQASYGDYAESYFLLQNVIVTSPLKILLITSIDRVFHDFRA